MTMHSILRLVLAAGIGAAALTVSFDASALVPGTITHQGRLFDAGGIPISGNFDIDFAIYDAVDAVAPIWMETHNVDIDEGYFSVALGGQTPFDPTVFDGSVRWVGITVGGDPEMTPRVETLSVPYAFIANDAIGVIHPQSVEIQNFGPVINDQGQWVGDPTGLVGPAGPAGPAGSAPNLTLAVFGVGPITHGTGNGWILETTAANTLQIRNTNGGFQQWSIDFPTGCAAQSATGQGTNFRFSTVVGETLSGTLCNEGSPAWVTINRENDNPLKAAVFRCWRYSGNANACQKMF
jgi:hypothetical protein